MNKQIGPRLGSASIVVSISDENGFTVQHGTDEVTLLHKPASECDPADWNRLWETLRWIAA